jgi:hypothetical protein
MNRARERRDVRAGAPGHWQRQGHQSQAAELMQWLAEPPGEGSVDERATRLLGVAQRHGLPIGLEGLRLVSQLAAGPGRPIGRVDVRALREMAQSHELVSRTEAAGARLPTSVVSAPPPRPAGFDLMKVPKDSVIDALVLLETNSDPVSNTSHAAPADPLFATWFKAYDMLGTRALTMAEMAGLNNSQVDWSGSETGQFERSRFNLRLIADDMRMDRHELHKYVGGFRGHPGVRTDSIAAGRGGESSLFARMTDVYNDHDLPTRWGEEAVIRDYWKAHRPAPRDSAASQPDEWARAATMLTTCTRELVLTKVHLYHLAGYFADPREALKLAPSVQALLASAPGSPQRADAAKAFAAILRDRANTPDIVSVSGATAEIQMTETLYRYMNTNHLDFKKPGDRIDVVEVYALYRQMLEAGELTSRTTVQGWLQAWGVAHQP